MKYKIAVVKLGCPKNEVDAEVLCGELIKNGFCLTSVIDDADIAVIFTCSFIKDAVSEAIDTILEILQMQKRVIVTGCLVSRYGEKTLEKLLPEVERFFGTYNFTDIAEYLRYGKTTSNVSSKFIYSSENERSINFEYAYVKISEGCSNRCSFCTIPMIKGNLFSRDMKDIIEEIKIISCEQNIKEIILISQNTGDYGKDLKNGTNINKLIENILNINEINWLKVMYIYPDAINDEFLELTKHEKFCNYLEMPVQHIDNEILKSMNRKSGEKSIRKILDKIKSEYPDIFLRTSLIVGFPGETEKQFEKLVDFIKEYRFYNLGCFVFSPEEGTKAFDYDSCVPENVAKERFDVIMEEQKQVAFEINSTLTGKVFKVNISGYSDETDLLLQGRTEFQAPDIDGKVYITEGFIESPGFYNVKISDFKEYDLLGKIV
jgi:ribosomal protein S12 methylthiotransferase